MSQMAGSLIATNYLENNRDFEKHYYLILKNCFFKFAIDKMYSTIEDQRNWHFVILFFYYSLSKNFVTLACHCAIHSLLSHLLSSSIILKTVPINRKERKSKF